MDPVVTVTGFDHVVLVVDDPERSLDFYTGVLGLAPVRVEEWRAGSVPFPSVRVNAETIIDLFPRHSGARVPTPGPDSRLDHLCLVIEPTDLAALAAGGAVEVVRGPSEQLFGAQGYATSLYIADPDGVTVELRAY
jgi:catechol 2,3-dioxygenase-like lactoylglutathione lyase family enzyme